MRLFLILWALGLWVLAEGLDYRLIHEGKSGDRGRMLGFVSAPLPLWLSDPLSEKTSKLPPLARHRLDYDDRSLAVYCVSRSESGREACHLLMQPNFGFEGVQQVLLGGRGERFVYVELARCGADEKNCLWPHRQLGQPVVLKLVQQGDEPRLFQPDKTRRLIAVGPFKASEGEAALRRISAVAPSARLIEENEVR
ncbi:MAG: hypothetical protein AB7E49_08460 [Campylobacterales bacterium]